MNLYIEHGHLLGSCLPTLENKVCEKWNIHPRIHLLKPLTVIPENFPNLWSMNILKFGEERDSVPKFAHQKVLLHQCWEIVVTPVKLMQLQ